ncbi:hypothetical protein Bca4012_063699 [Brassica carinata]
MIRQLGFGTMATRPYDLHVTLVRQLMATAQLTYSHWNSCSATKTNICPPTLRYFMRALANILLCRMEPNKVRMQELTLLYGAVNGLVYLSHLEVDDEVVTPNLGAIFAEHLVGVKIKPFTGTSQKTETVGSLLTPIFRHLGIRLDEDTAITTRRFLDEAHLLHSG